MLLLFASGSVKYYLGISGDTDYDNHIIGNPMTSYVGIDNEEGMDLAIGHLKRLGHQKIGYLSNALGSHVMSDLTTFRSPPILLRL